MEPKVFISHAKEDEAMAVRICDFLETKGIPCWISPRDILAGVEWSKAIMEGIHQANVMVLIFTSNSNVSPHILREVQIAVERGLKLIPLRVENIEPSEGLGYFISAPQWLEAFPAPLEEYLAKLTETINKLTTSFEKHPQLTTIPLRQVPSTRVKEEKYLPKLIFSAIGVSIATLLVLFEIVKDIRYNAVPYGLYNILGLAVNIVLLVAIFMSSNSQTRNYKLIRICAYILITLSFAGLTAGLARGLLRFIEYNAFGDLLLYGLILFLHRKEHK